jgi:hypothetical protein
MNPPPFCSVLIPTRGRVASLQAAIESFLRTADNPSDVEIVVRVHDDDPLSLSWWAKERLPNVRVIIGDTGDGYGSMHEFVASLCAASRGSWLWPSSDDWRSLTKGWDTKLAARCANPLDTPLVLSSTVPGRRLCIISRGLYHAVGHIGLTEHQDTYLFALADLAAIHETIDIDIQDAGLPEVGPRDRPKTWEQFRSAATAKRFNTDKLKLAAVLGRPIASPWTTSDAPTGIA